ncbi:MAG: hypothetical protein JKX84_03665, partial [Flavobacteriales bacterium]|nr:hypothetical protein [Flavobacteriales bacterium]
AVMITAIFMGFLFIVKWGFSLSERSFGRRIVETLAMLLLFVLPSLVAIFYSLELKDSGKLYHGADDDFWGNTILRLLFQFVQSWEIAEFLVTLMLVSYVAVLVRHFGRLIHKQAHILMALTLFASTFGIVVLHFVAGINYPIDRAGVHLFPLMITTWFFAIDSERGYLKWPLILVVCGVLCVPTFSNINFDTTPHWAREHIPVSYYNELSDWKDEWGSSPTVSCHLLAFPSLEYSDYLNKGKLNMVCNPEYPSSIADFVVFDSYTPWFSSDSYDTLYFNPSTGLGLLKQSNPLTWVLGYSVEKDTVHGGDGYFNLAKVLKDTMALKNVKATVRFTIRSPKYLKDMQLVYAAKDRHGEAIKRSFSRLHCAHPEMEEEMVIESSCVFENNKQEMDHLSIFVWNVNDIPLLITDVEVKFYSLEDGMEQVE